MPVHSDVYTLTLGTAIQIVPADNMAQEVTLHNMTKSSNEYIHIGGPDVTVNNSIHIDPGATISFTLRPSDSLWAVSDPGGLEVGVLRILKRD
jgi:hypothetical protein